MLSQCPLPKRRRAGRGGSVMTLMTPPNFPIVESGVRRPLLLGVIHNHPRNPRPGLTFFGSCEHGFPNAAD